MRRMCQADVRSDDARYDPAVGDVGITDVTVVHLGTCITDVTIMQLETCAKRLDHVADYALMTDVTTMWLVTQ